MPEPILSATARADLVSAWEYLAQYGEASADEFVELFWERADRHAKFPRMGRPRSDLQPDARSFVVGKYVILFRPVGATIEILRVVHGASDMRDVLRDVD